MQVTKGLSNVQLELLKLFSFDLPEKQLLEIKGLLSDYFANQITSEIDTLFEQNNWGTEKIEEWSKEHMRTPYKK